MTLADTNRSADIEDDEDEPIVQRIVSAGTVTPPITRAPISIFTIKKVLKVCRQRRKAKPELVRGEPTKVLQTVDGVTRVVGRGYPSDRWTPEKQEQELARRARQKPPRPTKKAKTRSKKLIDLIGDDSDT